MNHKNDSKRLEDIVDDFKKKISEADADKEKLLTRYGIKDEAILSAHRPPTCSYIYIYNKFSPYKSLRPPLWSSCYGR